ncbi:MAG: hypothetical protein M0R48_10510 [Candidatus Omnitrophica bacterium]|nr:hypothetical protein [Candidatus Omnitrophota bacterium]
MVENIVRITCENCGKVIEVKGVIGDPSYFYLSNCQDIENLDFQFCSLNCVRDWVEKEIQNTNKKQEPF